MSTPTRAFTFQGTVRLTVDADVAAAHPRVKPGQGEVDIVTAIELLEVQWRKGQQPPAATVAGSAPRPDDPSVMALTRTSVDDLKSTLPHITGEGMDRLTSALAVCEQEGMKTKATMLRRRIKQLERPA